MSPNNRRLEILYRLENLETMNPVRMVLLAVEILLIVRLIYGLANNRSNVSDTDEGFIFLNIVCMVIASIISMSVARSRRNSSEVSAFFFIIFFDIMHLWSDSVFGLVNGNPEHRGWNLVCNIVYLICPLMMTTMYWVMLSTWAGKHSRIHRWANSAIAITTAVGILLTLGNAVYPYYFGITEDGYYYRGELYILTIIIPLIMVVLCVGRITNCRLSLFEKLVLMTYPTLPILTVVAQNVFEVSAIFTVAIFISIVLVYTNFYSSREAELMEMENQLTMSRLHSLQMQINPHMLFNTMASIAGMCDIDPERSKDMIFKLSDYLRDNFTDVDKPIMAALHEELEQLDHYIAVQSMRFPNIKVEKDIAIDSFQLPRMSLQPLVENAIKHGICRRKNSEGTLKIRSFETKEAYVVSVEDNGVGFEGSVPDFDTKEHRGIHNVRTRLAMLCDGTLTVEGKPGEGAISTITIPKKWGGVALYSR